MDVSAVDTPSKYMLTSILVDYSIGIEWVKRRRASLALTTGTQAIMVPLVSASGQHECLQGQKRTQSYTDSKRNSDADEDVKWPTVHANSPVARGSSSMPVSRTLGRTGTPQPLPQPGIHYLPTNSSVSVNTVGIAHAQRFPPPQASLQQRLQQPYRQYGHGRRLDDDRDRLGLSERKGEWTGGIHYKLDTPG